MVKGIVPFLLAMCSSLALANVECELQTSPRVQSAVNLLEEALSRQVLSRSDLERLASAEVPYNPISLQARSEWNLAFKIGLDRRLAEFTPADHQVFRRALENMLVKYAAQLTQSKEGQAATVKVFPLRFIDPPDFEGWRINFHEARVRWINGRPIFTGGLQSPSLALGRGYIYDPFGPQKLRFHRTLTDGHFRSVETFQINGRNFVGPYSDNHYYDLDNSVEVSARDAGLSFAQGYVRASLAFDTPMGKKAVVVTGGGLYIFDFAHPLSEAKKIFSRSCELLREHVVGERSYATCVVDDNQILIYDLKNETMLPPIKGRLGPMIESKIELMYEEGGRTYVALNHHSYTSGSSTADHTWGVRIMDLETRSTRDFTPNERTKDLIQFMFIRGEPYAYYEVRGHLYFQGLRNQRYWKIEEAGGTKSGVHTFQANGRDYLFWGTKSGKVLVYDLEGNVIVATRQLDSIIFNTVVVEYLGNTYALIGWGREAPHIMEVAAPEKGLQP